MFGLPKQLFNYLICSYVDFYDFMQFSITCKEANKYYRKFMANESYAHSCSNLKKKIYKYVASALIVKKIRHYKSLIFKKSLSRKLIKKIKRKIKKLTNLVKFPKSLAFNRIYCVDLVLIGTRLSLIDRIKFTKNECEILIKYSREFQIIKYAGIYNIPFKPRNIDEETAYSFGQIKSDIMPKYINSIVLNRAVIKNKIKIVEKYIKHYNKNTYTLISVGGNAQMINLLKKYKIRRTSSIEPVVGEFICRRLIKVGNFMAALEIIDDTSIFSASSKHIENFIDYISNHPQQDNESLNELLYYYAVNALAKKNEKHLNRIQLSYPIMLFVAAHFTPPKMRF